MGMNEAPRKCFITDLPTTNLPSSRDTIDYFVEYNGRQHSFIFPPMFHTSEALKKNKYILSAFFFNGDWPLIEEQSIDDKIINHIIQNGAYPKKFESKVDYFLLYLFQNGGKEYKSLQFKNTDLIKAYANDSDEFMRVIKALESRVFIKYEIKYGDENDFIESRGSIEILIELLEPGREFGNKLDSKDNRNKVIDFKSYGSPVVFVYAPLKQAHYSNALNRLLDKNDFIIVKSPEIESYYKTSKFRGTTEQFTDDIYGRLKSQNIDFAIFIENYFSKNDPLSIQLNEYKLASSKEFPQDIYSRIYFGSSTTDNIAKNVDERFNGFDLYDIILENKRFDLVRLIASKWKESKQEKDREPILEQKGKEKEEKADETIEEPHIAKEKKNEIESQEIRNEVIDENKDVEQSVDDGFTLKSFRPPEITDQVAGVIGVTEIADVLAKIISGLKTEEKARMIGIFGRWGRGKTFLYEHLIKNLPEDKDFIHVDFHAWKYQDTPAVWAYLYEVIVEKYYNRPNTLNIKRWLGYLKRRSKLNISRYGWMPMLKVAGIIILQSFIWILFYALREYKDDIVGLWPKLFGTITISVSTTLVFIEQFRRKYSKDAKEILHKYTERLTFKEHLGIQAEIQKELKTLFKVWFPNKKKQKNKIPKKLILFVDDIDRCSEDKILLLIDALRVMVEDPEISMHITIITAIDERVLLRAVYNKYYNLLQVDLTKNEEEKKKTLCNISKEYLDKLFLTGIKLGELSENERGEVFDAFTIDKETVNIPSDINPNVDDNETIINPEIAQESNTPFGDISDLLKEDLSKNVNDNLHELEFLEYSQLKKLIIKYNKSTPRGIRIYYYRYLLAKSLFNYILENRNLRDSWKAFGRKEFLPSIVLHYSMDDNISNINDNRPNLTSDDENDDTVKLFGEDYKIDKKLLNSLLDVVEMVVPY